MHKKTGRWILIIVSLITIFFSYTATTLEFNYDFESYFPVNDPDLNYYQEFMENFPSDNDYLLIAIENRGGIFDSEFLADAYEFTNLLDTVNLINQTVSALSMGVPVMGPLGPVQLPYFHIKDTSRYKQDSIRIWKSDLILNNLVSSNGKALAFLINHKAYITKAESDQLVESVNAILKQFPFDNVRMAGKANAQQVYIEKTKKELLVFVSASVVLVIALLTMFYRSWWGVLIPLLVVLIGIIWTFGFMGATGKKIDILMVLLPTILFVVGMSDVVHIISKYLEELRIGKNKIAALWVTVREIGLATFLTSITTAIGFFTLLTARIIPIREFGVYTGLGVFFAYITAFTLLPAILLFLKKPAISRQQQNRKKWNQVLGSMMILVSRKRWIVVVVSGIIVLISGIGISLIKINTYLVEGLPSDDPLKQDFIFFDEKFGGSRPFELALELEDSANFFDYEIIKQINSIEEFIVNTYQAGNIFSPATVVKTINQAIHTGNPDYFTIPDEEDYNDVIRYLKMAQNSGPIQNVIAKEANIARISGKIPDMGSFLALQKNDSLIRFSEKILNDSPLSIRITGTSLLLDNNNLYLSKGMISGLSIAFLVIALITALMFKSIRMILIVLIPNVIPLLMVAGIMGFFNIPLQLGTSIIFTIAFGIAVDDTIHFTSKLRIELGKGKSLMYALKRTYLSTGKAIIVTTIILSGGFLTLLLSSFTGTFYTGLLVSITLILAVVSDLTLMPALLVLFFKRK